MFASIEYSVTALVCLITAFVIQRIYFKEKKRNASQLAINGIKWFGLAIFIWGLGALLNLILVYGFYFSVDDKTIIYLGVVFSLLNSLFILLSIPSIEHKGNRNIVIRMIERFTNREVFVIFGGLFAIIAFVFISATFGGTGAISNTYIWLIDIPISLIVAFILLQELNKAFASRSMQFMYLPSFALFILIVIAVSHRIFPVSQVSAYMGTEVWQSFGMITAIVFKFLFIVLFTILLYSWKFLSETEQRQTQLEMVIQENNELKKTNQRSLTAIESHLDTIENLKVALHDTRDSLTQLKEDSRIELSDRQKEVLANLWICKGKKSYTEIADAMHISPDGFQAHIHQIKKLLQIKGASGKDQLIAYAEANELGKHATIAQNEKPT
ncbi:hypothetical protein [Ascidiimonas sp. W6]|uniref:helix-turn-helix domain-containing protein n=1 Tax=Ascidiimonas meishanensis TaxID=3128903 RepID=UPI0030ED2386